MKKLHPLLSVLLLILDWTKDPINYETKLVEREALFYTKTLINHILDEYFLYIMMEKIRLKEVLKMGNQLVYGSGYMKTDKRNMKKLRRMESWMV